MSNDWDDFVNGLANEPLPASTKATGGKDAKTTKFPCQVCQGTGLWTARRINRHGNDKCNACQGRGYFLTSERDRQKARETARATKARKLEEAIQDFERENPGVADFLRSAAQWSEFAGSLAVQLATKGFLSERQVASVYSMKAKMEAREEAKAREKAAASKPSAQVDLGPIRSMFETAVQSGYKAPTYRAAGLVINRAPDSGRNPGALYVKDTGGTYLGKIIGMDFIGKSEAREGLLAIAADPKGEAVRFGRQTGRCSCCGRELTDPVSIAAGIGPICADKWGL